MEAPVITKDRVDLFLADSACYIESGERLKQYRGICDHLIETYLIEVEHQLDAPKTRLLLESLDSLTTVLASPPKITTMDILRNGEGGDGRRVGVKLRAEVDRQKTIQERHNTYGIVKMVYLGNPRAGEFAEVLAKRWEL